MNFIDEEHIVFFEVGQQGRQVFGLFQNRPAGLPQIHTEFMGNDMAQRGFAQARRAEQQHMVQRLTAFLGCANENFELFANLGLTDILVQQLGPQGALNRFFLGRGWHARYHAARSSRGEIVSLDGHESGFRNYLAKARKARRMPSLTPISAGSAFRASTASLSL